MRTLQIAALSVFALGIALLVVGLILRDDGDAGAVQSGNNDPAPTFQATPTNTPTPSPSPTPVPTDVPTPVPPTATSTPFAGTVARMVIPRFDVDSGTEEIGLIEGVNQLDTPHDPLKVGWYYIYDRPGWGGNSVFSAHVDYYPNILGPFNKLAEMAIDDEIHVVMADGSTYKYRVISLNQWPVDTIPMGDLIWPQTKPADVEWITLITCGGEFVPHRPGGPGSYIHRDVVVAERFQ